MIEVAFSCRWRKLSTHVKSAMGKQQLSRINSANCPGIYTQTIDSEMYVHHEKLSHVSELSRSALHFKHKFSCCSATVGITTSSPCKHH